MAASVGKDQLLALAPSESRRHLSLLVPGTAVAVQDDFIGGIQQVPLEHNEPYRAGVGVDSADSEQSREAVLHLCVPGGAARRETSSGRFPIPQKTPTPSSPSATVQILTPGPTSS